MSLRRSIAALFAVGAVCAVSGCGADLNNSAANDTSSDGASAGGASSSAAAGGDKGVVRISGQDFPEATLVADMYQQLLAHAGYDPKVNLVDTRAVYIKTFPGTIDVVPEYVGALVNQLNADANGDNAKPLAASNPADLINQSKSLLDKAGITLLNPSAATDSDAFFVTQAYSEANNVTKLSQLSGKSLVLAAQDDCDGRLDCATGLERYYGIKFSKILPLGFASAQTYKSVSDGESQLGETSTTDGTLTSQKLVVLDDDKHIQTAQNLVPAVSSTFLKAHPDVAGVLNPLMAKLTTDNLTELNADISVNREDPADVAKKFLTDQGLL